MLAWSTESRKQNAAASCNTRISLGYAVMLQKVFLFFSLSQHLATCQNAVAAAHLKVALRYFWQWVCWLRVWAFRIIDHIIQLTSWAGEREIVKVRKRLSFYIFIYFKCCFLSFVFFELCAFYSLYTDEQ